MPGNLENSVVATGLEKVFIPITKRGKAIECSNYHTIVLISHVREVMHKILQTRLQRYVNWELPDVQAGFRKGREIRDQIVNICWIIEKAREFQKILCSIDYATAFDCVDPNKLQKILGNTRSPYLRNLYTGQEATAELDMEQGTGPKLGKE